jgi:hypothetical protein
LEYFSKLHSFATLRGREGERERGREGEREKGSEGEEEKPEGYNIKRYG